MDVNLKVSRHMFLRLWRCFADSLSDAWVNSLMLVYGCFRRVDHV